MKRAMLGALFVVGCATSTPFAAPSAKPLHPGLAAGTGSGPIDESAFVGGLPAVRPTPAVAAPTILEARTKNGVRILGLERRDLPTVSFSIALKVAASDDDAPGFGELAIDAIRRSTKAHEAGDIYSRWDQLAVWWHTTSVGDRGELLELSAVRPLALVSLGPALDVFGDTGLRSEDVESARDGITTRNRRDRAPDDVAYDVAMERLFPKTGVHRFADGERLSHVTASELRGFAARALTGDNLVVAAAGDLDWKAVVEHVEEGLGALPAHGSLSVAEPGDPPAAAVVLVPREVRQSEVTIAFRAPPIGDPDRVPLALAREAIGGALWRSLRLTHGVTYGAGVELYLSSFVISTSVEAGSVLQGITGALEAIARATRLVDEDVVRDRELAQSRIYSGFGTNRGAVERLAFLGALELPVTYYAQRVEEYGKVTAADVARVVQKYLRRELAQIVIVGETAGLASVLETKQLGPVTTEKY